MHFLSTCMVSYFNCRLDEGFPDLAEGQFAEKRENLHIFWFHIQQQFVNVYAVGLRKRCHRFYFGIILVETVFFYHHMTYIYR